MGSLQICVASVRARSGGDVSEKKSKPPPTSRPGCNAQEGSTRPSFLHSHVCRRRGLGHSLSPLGKRMRRCASERLANGSALRWIIYVLIFALFIFARKRGVETVRSPIKERTDADDAVSTQQNDAIEQIVRNTEQPQHAKSEANRDNESYVLTSLRPGHPIIQPGKPIGQYCNRMHLLAIAAFQAKRNQRDLVLWGDVWAEWVKNDFDIELFGSYFAPHSRLIVLSPEQAPKHQWARLAEEEGLKNEEYDPLWCALTSTWDVIRHYLRPNKQMRDKVDAKIAVLRGSRNLKNDVLAVHQRDFTPWCPTMLPTCTSDSDFLPKREMCPYSLDSLLVNEIKKEWPAVADSWLRGSRPVSLALLTDNFNKPARDTFLKSPMLRFAETSATTDNKTSMLEDMWLAVKSDYYVGSAMSSCEPIVAMWRNDDRIYPRACFGQYRDRAEPASLSEACEISRYLTLDKIRQDVPPCEGTLMLSAALAKARQQRLGLLVLGSWIDWIREHLDEKHLVREALARGVKVKMSRVETFKKWKRVRPSTFFYPLLDLKAELSCAAGITSEWTRSVLRPRLGSNGSVAERAKTAAAPSSELVFCRNSSATSATIAAPREYVSLSNLWEVHARAPAVYSGMPSACQQLSAAWRLAQGLLPWSSDVCWGTYDVRSEAADEAFVGGTRRFANGFNEEGWTCGTITEAHKKNKLLM